MPDKKRRRARGYIRDERLIVNALGDVAEPTNLVLRGAPASDEMAAYLPRLTRVLEDAAAENRNVKLTR